ncbi:MAG: 4Fe-4S dicluster domain-containing protein [Bacteroidales bacterium]|nr:4Fe-4S dicluster domain-containing protein [Bacteroidales bacterium]
MRNFGFATTKSRTVDYSKIDTRLIGYILENEPTFNACLSCGSCTAICSAGNLTNFNIRKLSLLIRLGELEKIHTEIDKCMLCGKCLLECPRGINTRNVIMLIKKGLTIFDIKDQE